MRELTLGSLFDGSGGFPLAAALEGIRPVWASEVEPYPIAVTRSRFPHMKHYGDVSKINGAEIEPVDILSFGSPCQDLSVAGLRQGLRHEGKGDKETTRSGLFLEAIRIIKEMREATHGVYPAFAIFENVTGAFSSSKGEDFRTVLNEFVNIVEPGAEVPSPPQGKWAYADILVGDGWSIAYRVLDAQFWGVPQRRRRVFLVASFRTERAGKILFERAGLHGHNAPLREAWERTAAETQNGVGTADTESVQGIINLNKGDVQSKRVYDPAGRAPALSASSSAWMGPELYVLAAQQGNAESVRGVGINGDIAGTLDASYYKGCGMREGKEREVVCMPIHDKATRHAGKRGEKHDGAGNGLGVGADGDSMYTLMSGDRHAVAYAPIVGGLNAGDYKGPGKQYVEENKLVIEEDKMEQRYIVRRLTPLECCRLQGFPDGWGETDAKEDFTDEEFEFWLDVRNTHGRINGKAVRHYTKAQMLTWYNKLHTDSAEYKMWGNGIALPCARYVMQGIVDAVKEDEENV